MSAEAPVRPGSVIGPVTRPITMAILAMGGEGGGVLADWTVALAEDNGWFAQSTSVPGVAQRTGATVYYVELLPKDGSGRYPILSTMPTPGEVDIVVASELMEAGRSVVRGFATPDRTTLIASTSRTYAMPERTAMGEGRVDSAELIAAAEGSFRRFIRGDFARIADQTGSVISAVLFGALAGANVPPFTREQFEQAIRAGGKGVDASLRAFSEGYRVAAAPPAVDIQIGTRPAEVAVTPPSILGPRLQAQSARIATMPEPARAFLVEGARRTAEYQDVAYADEYLDRIATVATVDTTDDHRITTEAARYTALWMTYEDTIRVAFHKVRAKRFDRIRTEEARADDAQMVQIREYLHPQVEEISDTMPTALGRWILNSRAMNRLIHRITHQGIKIQTTSFWGYTVLYVLARLQPIRRRSLRFGQEQARIDAWLGRVRAHAATNPDLAYEIVQCQQVVKGYGETHANGMRNFNAMMDALPRLADDPNAAQRLANLRKLALSDDSGKALRDALNSASLRAS